MSKQISLTLADDLVRRAEALAGHSGREVADVLAEAIAVSLDPLGPADADPPPPLPPSPPPAWTDEQVLADADAAMPAAEDQTLTALLDRQQAGRLSRHEAAELAALMQMYQQGQARKALGLAEGVRRGLRPAPLP